MENGTSYVSPSAPGGTPGALPGIGIPPSAPGGGAPGVTPFQEALMSRMTRPFGLAVSQKLFVTIKTHISLSHPCTSKISFFETYGYIFKPNILVCLTSIVASFLKFEAR